MEITTNIELGGGIPDLYLKFKPANFDDATYIKTIILNWLVEQDCKEKEEKIPILAEIPNIEN